MPGTPAVCPPFVVILEFLLQIVLVLIYSSGVVARIHGNDAGGGGGGDLLCT